MVEQNRPLVSMIVPIYRIDRYIGICIESLINQTYRNIEIILVNDGSDDRCPKICDLYAKKDKRVKVIHKKNGGLVSARKAGLERSAGDYIGYVDGDDWIDSRFVERMVSDALECGADIVCAGFTRDLNKKSALVFNKYPIGVYSGKELDGLKQKMLSDGEFYYLGITTYVWNKLFKREVVYAAQMNVDERISIGEDAAVTYPAIMESKCVRVTGCVDYHYRQHSESMLKQTAGYDVEMDKLRVLADYLFAFASKYDEKYMLKKQITDYVVGNCLIRCGGRLPGSNGFNTFDTAYYGKKVVVFNAGTFGQQLVNRFSESVHCEIVKWIDDDFREYRHCGVDVDSVESIVEADFDYVLIATLNPIVTKSITRRLLALGVASDRILKANCPEEKRESLLKRYLYDR